MKRSVYLLSLLCLSSATPCLSQWGPERIIKSVRDSIVTIAYSYNERTIATDTFGRVHVVWTQFPIDTAGNPYPWLCYQRSTDWGASWENSIQLNQPNRDVEFPCIAADGLGNVHVVRNGLAPGGGYGAIYRRSPDGGRSWEPETVLVVNSYGFPYAKVEANRRGGTVHVVWSYGGVSYKRSSDGGKTWGSDTLLSGTPYGAANISVVLDSKGRPHIAWYEDIGLIKPGRIWYKNSSDEGLTWNPSVMVADSDTTLPGGPNIAVDGLDRVYVFFMAYWGSKPDSTWSPQIVYRVSKDTGQTFGPRQALTVYPHDPTPASVTGDIFGGVHAVWQDCIPRPPPGFSGLDYNGSTDGGRTWRFDPPILLTGPLGSIDQSITADSRGKVHLVYLGVSQPWTFYILYRNGYPLGVEERPVEGSNVDPSVSFRVYPNPMTSLAHFRIQAPGNTKPSLKIYDITGRLVRDLSSKLMPRMKEVVWDGRDEVGNVLPSGVYLCRLEGEGFEPRHQAVVLAR